MNYLILSSNGHTNVFSFQEDVNQKIKDGYMPIGGLSVVPMDLLDRYEDGVVFYQAMCKKEG